MKLIPEFSRRLLVTVTASLALLFPLSLAALGSPAAASTAHPTGTAATIAGQATNPSCPWLNQSLSVAARVGLLLSKMTLANEITMVEGQGTGQPYVFYMAAQPSLCIPALGLEDGPLGVGDGLTGVTQMPAGVALAATFDTSLARQWGAVIGQEEWGKGAAVNLGPTVNILRDPRWGRSFEAFTEDPFLNAAVAVSRAGRAHLRGRGGQPAHRGGHRRGRAGGDAMAGPGARGRGRLVPG
jgi:beta-glucosidase